MKVLMLITYETFIYLID